MDTSGIRLSLCLLALPLVGAACAAPTGAGAEDAAGSLNVVAPPDAGSEDAGPSMAEPMVCGKLAIGHTIDGAFTGWPECDLEWEGVQGVPGIYGVFYSRLKGQTLHVLNDWLLCDVDLPPDWYNLFYLTLVYDDGVVRNLEIRVYADDHLEAWEDGFEIYVPPSHGAMGFGASPNAESPHTLFEFRLYLGDVGALSGLFVKEDDPGGTSTFGGGPGSPNWPSNPRDGLVEEPTVFIGTRTEDGLVVEAASGPTLVQLQLSHGEPGDPVRLVGGGLGEEPGQVFFGVEEASVVTWSATVVDVVVPEGVAEGDSAVHVETASAGPSNALMFTLGCDNSCAGKTCGPDLCGGECGDCEGGLCLGWQCCYPSCPAGTCGDDGCGGDCGDCVSGVCLDGSCCTPECDGKTCGDDACGGLCGVCAGGETCTDGACCAPECDGHECGADGCGGVCGCAGEGEVCFAGGCCAPDCDGKVCGLDKCGGTCGSCPVGQPCIAGGCCVPDCEGLACGPNGCGGICGNCGVGAKCEAGACVCEPDCAGKACGGDGCGGSCGGCAPGAVCDDGGQCCVPDCEHKGCGPDGCGGTCGVCPSGQSCAGGVCL